MNQDTKPNSNRIQAWGETVIQACRTHDSDLAYPAWKRWNEMQSLLLPDQKQRLVSLREKLYYTAFPSMPTEEAKEVLEKFLVKFLIGEVDIDEMMKNRFLYIGYGNENTERESLRGAVLHNTEKIGPKTISEWAKNFDTAVKNMPDDIEDAARWYFTRESSIAALDRNTQALLQRFLNIYGAWLAFPLINIYDAAEMYKTLVELEKKGVKKINPSMFQQRQGGVQAATVSGQRLPSSQMQKMPLLKALAEYPQLGQQTITGGRIKLKGQPEPQRGSLNNWIRAYRDELGVGFHDEVQRGHFLFQSVNGRNLSAEEREHLNLILKSIEENTPLDIDPMRQIILFPPTSAPRNVAPKEAREIAPRDFVPRTAQPTTSVRTIPARPFPQLPNSPAFINASRPAVAAGAAEQPKTGDLSIRHTPQSLRKAPERSFGSFAPSPAKNIAGETLHFSTGHVLPAEESEARAVLPRTEAKMQASPVAPKPPTPQPIHTPYSIRPLRLRNERRRDEEA